MRIVSFTMLLMICATSYSAVDGQLNAIIEAILTNGITDELNGNTEVGENICKAGGGAFCAGSSIGEGICRAGGGAFCAGSNPAEGLCKARKGRYCNGITISRALALEIVDSDWAWDQFRQPNAFGRIWACRGLSTGRFADDSKCSLKPKTDTTWPNN